MILLTMLFESQLHHIDLSCKHLYIECSQCTRCPIRCRYVTPPLLQSRRSPDGEGAEVTVGGWHPPLQEACPHKTTRTWKR